MVRSALLLIPFTLLLTTPGRLRLLWSVGGDGELIHLDRCMRGRIGAEFSTRNYILAPRHPPDPVLVPYWACLRQVVKEVFSKMPRPRDLGCKPRPFCSKVGPNSTLARTPHLQLRFSLSDGYRVRSPRLAPLYSLLISGHLKTRISTSLLYHHNHHSNNTISWRISTFHQLPQTNPG